MELTKSSHVVMPQMTNPNGTLFGGQMLSWMDELAGISAKRFAETDITMAAVEQVTFKRPVPIGAYVDITAEVISVGNTSLKIKVSILVEKNGITEVAAEGIFTGVSIDRDGHPQKIAKSLNNGIM